ncbi:MAG: glycosyltransferase [Candidatus Scalindua sp.]
MTEKRLVATRCDSNAKKLANVTHEMIRCYCHRWGADFKVIGDEEGDTGDYQKNHYRIFKVADYLDEYDRVLVLDSDIIIMPDCENPFDVVAPDKIGSIYEDKGSRQIARRQTIRDIQAEFGDVGWHKNYINTGVFMVSKKHKKIFRRITKDISDTVGELWTGTGIDDVLIGYNIHRYNFEVQELSFKWNHMSMFSEPWNNNANRFNSYIIHYAGAANFPDDLSGRLKGTNDLDSRMRLIIDDTNRIAEGLSGFTVIDPTPKQGLGSTCFNALIGVQEKEIIVKLHSTADGLKRECDAFDGKDIPYIVDCYGVSKGSDGNHYMMLQKLRDLPEVIDAELMRKIATRSLIALRQLWKYDIPWICKLDHIMLNNEGEPKLIDFGDDPCPKIPFYGYEGQEAIIMEGECYQAGPLQGMYKDRAVTPRSGWLAIMSYLCQKNNIPADILYEAEYAMIAYEYQHLENVHQPIYFEQYKEILRRETEKDDSNYGKLVEANRNCEDRAKMIHKHCMDVVHQSWLDIGCNIGWFCFYFNHLVSEMTGIDSDKAKIEFATMLAEGEKSSVTFEHAEINLEYVKKMPCYDIISALSTLHLKLVEDKESSAFWELFYAICEKVNNILFFEFPPHAFKYLDINSIEDFIENVEVNGKFKAVTQIGVSDANRPVLKCVK